MAMLVSNKKISKIEINIKKTLYYRIPIIITGKNYRLIKTKIKISAKKFKEIIKEVIRRDLNMSQIDRDFRKAETNKKVEGAQFALRRTTKR